MAGAHAYAPIAGDPFHPGLGARWSLGGDLRWTLGTSLHLNATVNPDFGQVEADPSVVVPEDARIGAHVVLEAGVLLGAGVGLLSGMFGVGGGFLTTPLLIVYGIPPTVAAASGWPAPSTSSGPRRSASRTRRFCSPPDRVVTLRHWARS